MIVNYCKMAWRSLFRNKLHTAINLGGLVIGFTIGITILLFVYAQFTFDNFHKNGKRIYQAYQVFNRAAGEEVQNQFSLAAGPAYKTEVKSIEKVTRIFDGGNHIEVSGKDLIIPVTMVDEDFFSMFSFPLIKAAQQNPLKNLSDAVLSEDAAKKIFGNEEPVGKTIKASAGGTMQTYIVSAVVKNQVNSSINFQVLTRIETRSNYAADRNQWNAQSHGVFVQLLPGATAKQAEAELRIVDKRHVPAWYDDLKKEGARPDKFGDVFATRLLPMQDVHFSARVNNNRATSPMQLLTILTVGLLILFIACFNFVNINLANAFTRSREIGVRKCLGASKSKLFLQLWGESFLICVIAFGLSTFFVNILLHSFEGFEKIKVSLLSVIWQPRFILISLGLLVFVSLLAGGYPSWLIIRFRVVETLKGNLSLKRNSLLRSSLIVMQFVIACIMISCTYIIYQQFQFLQTADTGINKDYVISVLLHHPEKGQETIEKLRSRLHNDPAIVTVSGSDINMGRGSDHRSSKTTISFGYNGQQITSNRASVGFDYLRTFGVKLLQGRDFDKSFGMDTMNSILISESVAKQFHEKNLIGKIVGGDSSFRGWQIIGIFRDFHLYTMQEAMEPLTLSVSNAPINYCFVKVGSQNPVVSMATIKKQMTFLEPGQDFNASFVNENIKNWYEAEKMMSVLFSVASIVAIILSCSGLLAMVMLIVSQRVKEIGVRKVLGASVQNISVLISKEFVYLVIIALLIATPISWIVMNSWLASFAYRIQVELWMFALVALTAICIAMLTIGFNTVRAAKQNPVKSLRSE